MIWPFNFSSRTMIYPDFNHKHVYTYWNKAQYPYTMSSELYHDKKYQLYTWDWYFKKFLTKLFWVSKRCPAATLFATRFVLNYIFIDPECIFMFWCMLVVINQVISLKTPITKQEKVSKCSSSFVYYQVSLIMKTVYEFLIGKPSSLLFFEIS